MRGKDGETKVRLRKEGEYGRKGRKPWEEKHIRFTSQWAPSGVEIENFQKEIDPIGSVVSVITGSEGEPRAQLSPSHSFLLSYMFSAHFSVSWCRTL